MDPPFFVIYILSKKVNFMEEIQYCFIFKKYVIDVMVSTLIQKWEAVSAITFLVEKAKSGVKNMKNTHHAGFMDS